MSGGVDGAHFDYDVDLSKGFKLPKGFTLDNALTVAYLLLAGFLAWSMYQSNKRSKKTDAYFSESMDHLRERVDAPRSDNGSGPMGFKLRSVPTTSDYVHPTTDNDAS